MKTLAMSLHAYLKGNAASAYSKGAFHLVVSMLLVHGVTLASQVFLARMLGPSLMGHVAVMKSVMALLTLFAGFGISTAVLKYVSSSPDAREKRKILRQALLLTGGTSLCTMAVMLVLTFVTSAVRDEVANHGLRFLVFSLPFATGTGVMTYYYHGLKQIQLKAKIDLLMNTFSAMLLIGTVYLWQLQGYIWGVLGFSAVSFGVLLWRSSEHLERFRWDAALARRLLGFGAWGLLANSAAQMVSTASVLVLATFLPGSEKVGQYSVAVMVLAAFRLIPSALFDMAFPYMSERAHDVAACRRMFWNLMGKFSLFAVALCAAGFAFGGTGIRIVLGPQYADSEAPFRILLVGLLFWALGGVGGRMILAMGKPNVNFYIVLLDGITCIALNIFLVQRMGIAGAAWATSLTYALRFLVTSAVMYALLRGGKDGRNSKEPVRP